MHSNLRPASPTSHSQLFQKNNKLYQQIIGNNYLQDRLQTSEAPAAIKFASPSQPLQKPPCLYEQEEGPFRTPKYGSLVRSIETTKNSHHITQSLGSNYSIIEMENQSYSTLNIYSMSRNVEQDHSLSSGTVTQKLNHEDSVPIVPEESKQSDLLLEGSLNRQAPTVKHISCLEEQDRLKKYKSEQFDVLSSQDKNQESDDEVNSPLPRLLADKYLRNSIKGKFSNSQKSEPSEGQFKPVLNEIHVVPYKINESVQPYAFSIPAQIPKDNTLMERRAKASSLKLHYSRQRDSPEDEEMEKNSPILYLSNHQHKRAYEVQYRSPIMNHQVKMQRPVPKSQPKQVHFSNEKTTRSNSIDCKNKPLLPPAKIDFSNPQIPSQHLDHSRVIRLFNTEEKEHMNSHYDNSIMYQESQINLCCGVKLRNKEEVNKINYHKIQSKPTVSNQQEHHPRSIKGYKINPVAMIKSKHSDRQSESQKKGIKLTGYHASFRKAE